MDSFITPSIPNNMAGDESVKVIKVDAKHFVVTSNSADILPYTEDTRLVTFFGRDDKGSHTSYAFTHR